MIKYDIKYGSKMICSECFCPASGDIIHNQFVYCDVECLNERLNMDRTYEWVLFKNLTDIYNNEEPLGSLTLLA